LSPFRHLILYLDTVHRYFEFSPLDFHQKVVIVGIRTLVRVVSGTGDGIGVGAPAAGHEVSYSATLVTLVVMNMTGENDDPRAHVFLLLLEERAQLLFGWAGGAATATASLAAGTGDWRMVQADKHSGMNPKKRIALVAHDNKKTDLLDWVRFNRALLAEHELFATGTTGGLVEEELGIPVVKLQSGPLGGDQQIGAMHF
jgi:hypothetical protein